jgi:hypothetical protein
VINEIMMLLILKGPERHSTRILVVLFRCKTL